MVSSNDLYDVIVIGGGPGGMTAALYTGRGQAKTLLLCKGALGGTMLMTSKYENFPSYAGGIATFELAQRFENHMKQFDVKQEMDNVVGLRFFEGGPLFEVEGEAAKYIAKAVIVATGATPKLLDVPGMKRLFGHGVSTCAVCDGFFYKGKNVAVVGGGDAAVEEAVYLTRFADSVKLVHRRDEFRACQFAVNEACENPKVEILYESIITEVLGESKVEGIKVRHLKTCGETIHPVSGLFVYVGSTGNTEFIELDIDKDDGGFIHTDSLGSTKIPGLFAVGDVRDEPYRQAVIACGHAATAGLAVDKYLKTIPEAALAKFV